MVDDGRVERQAVPEAEATDPAFALASDGQLWARAADGLLNGKVAAALHRRRNQAFPVVAAVPWPWDRHHALQPVPILGVGLALSSRLILPASLHGASHHLGHGLFLTPADGR